MGIIRVTICDIGLLIYLLSPPAPPSTSLAFCDRYVYD